MVRLGRVLPLLVGLTTLACTSRTIDIGDTSTESSEGSSDSDATSTPGDGDGEPPNNGDGDGDDDLPGDGDGDGDPPGDGDGEPPGDGDGEPSEFSCDCVELDAVCPSAMGDGTAMNDCELPSPCGVVDGSAEAATCVLELLIAGAPARFAYNVTSSQGCGGGYNQWIGWFYILGPGAGVDNECFVDECDVGLGNPATQTPAGTLFAIEAPSYFADCLGESASVMTGCIFNGLEAGPAVGSCL